jgi:hypothetical protein
MLLQPQLVGFGCKPTTAGAKTIIATAPTKWRQWIHYFPNKNLFEQQHEILQTQQHQSEDQMRPSVSQRHCNVVV